MEIIQVIGVALAGAVLCLLLKQYKPEYAIVCSVMCSIVIFSLIISKLTPIFVTLTGLMNKTFSGTEYSKTIIKALGICYIAELAAETCKDAEQAALASKVTIAAKIAIVILCLPMFKELTDVAINLIEI